MYAPPEAALADTDDDSAPTFAWHDVADGDEVDVGGLRLTFSRTDHPPETLAVRVDGRRQVASATRPTPDRGWSLAALGPGLDLALCEARPLRQDEEGLQHLSARQAGATARAAASAASSSPTSGRRSTRAASRPRGPKRSARQSSWPPSTRSTPFESRWS